VQIDALRAAERADVGRRLQQHRDLRRGVDGGAGASAMDQPVAQQEGAAQLGPSGE